VTERDLCLGTRPRIETYFSFPPPPPLPHNGHATTTFGSSRPDISWLTTQGFEYTRSLNPNRLAFETLVASLELPTELGHVSASTEKLPPALAFASGSAVTQAIVSSLVPAGGHIVSVGDVYGGTYRYFTKVASTQGIDTSFVHISVPDGVKVADEAKIEADLEAGFNERTKLVWVETPTNPTLSLIDIALVARVARRHGAIVVVDNTFMSPYYQQPLRLGADIVTHSVTKYINGHSE
jgi:cystathionine gamma-lyase